MKKLLILLLMMTLVLNVNYKAVNAASVTNGKFTDISDHWAKTSILQAIQKGYVQGYPDGTFRPDKNVTRVEFIKLIVSSLKLTVTNETYVNWYDPYEKAASLAGIYVDGDFKNGDMDTNMSRLEMSRASVRATGGQTTDEKKWMYLATNVGLIMGMDKTGTLGEEQSTTRAQSIAVIERILNIKSGSVLPADKHAISRAEVLWHRTNITSLLPRYFGAPLNKPEMFDASAMDFTGANGNITCNTQQFVAVDMEDTNDPYLSLVPIDLKMRIGINMVDIPKNTYIIISLNHIKVKKKYGIMPNYQPCYTMFNTLTQLDPKGNYYQDSLYSLVTVTPAYSQIDKFIDDIEIDRGYPHTFDVLKDQKYKTFFVMPKVDLTTSIDRVYVRYNHPLDFAGEDTEVYQSRVNKDIHQ